MELDLVPDNACNHPDFFTGITAFTLGMMSAERYHKDYDIMLITIGNRPPPCESGGCGSGKKF